MPADLSVTTLKAGAAEGDGPSFLEAEVIPGRAMMLYQLRARLPGRGVIDVLASPPLSEGLARLGGGPGDAYGNAAFAMGAAFLAPFVNRIRGRFLPETHEIETRVDGRLVRLPANGGGKAPDAEPYALHGLILDRAAEAAGVESAPGGQRVRAALEAGDFGGRWPSRLRFGFDLALTAEAFSATMSATNVGDEATPVGLGWHPYFALPSGDRTQARLHVPGRSRLPVDNYDAVLPTGEIRPVAGGPYDFSGRAGAALGGLYLDDCFVDLAKTGARETVCEVIDPAAGHGVRIVAQSPQVTAVQTFAPPERPILVVEPQFSWADPYGGVWAPSVDTGMVTLPPGASVDYRVRLELFRP
jgi:galactose mutarotase-like enzyme